MFHNIQIVPITISYISYFESPLLVFVIRLPFRGGSMYKSLRLACFEVVSHQTKYQPLNFLLPKVHRIHETSNLGFRLKIPLIWPTDTKFRMGRSPPTQKRIAEFSQTTHTPLHPGLEWKVTVIGKIIWAGVILQLKLAFFTLIASDHRSWVWAG